jgi:hypothetical protein
MLAISLAFALSAPPAPIAPQQQGQIVEYWFPCGGGTEIYIGTRTVRFPTYPAPSQAIAESEIEASFENDIGCFGCPDHSDCDPFALILTYTHAYSLELPSDDPPPGSSAWTFVSLELEVGCLQCDPWG